MANFFLTIGNFSILFFTVGPLDVRITESNQPFTASRKYELICQSSGSRPPAQVTWWKDGRRLDKTKDTVSDIFNSWFVYMKTNFRYFFFAVMCKFSHLVRLIEFRIQVVLKQ